MYMQIFEIADMSRQYIIHSEYENSKSAIILETYHRRSGKKSIADTPMCRTFPFHITTNSVIGGTQRKSQMSQPRTARVLHVEWGCVEVKKSQDDDILGSRSGGSFCTRRQRPLFCRKSWFDCGTGEQPSWFEQLPLDAPFSRRFDWYQFQQGRRERDQRATSHCSPGIFARLHNWNQFYSDGPRKTTILASQRRRFVFCPQYIF